MRTNGARPYDGHLLLAVSRVRLQANLSRQLVELARETDSPLPSKGATAGGDPMRLRGIPCVGRGISGATGRSRPESVLDKLEGWMPLHPDDARLSAEYALERKLAVLSQEIPGTSPGTEPLEALLAAEQELADGLAADAGDARELRV